MMGTADKGRFEVNTPEGPAINTSLGPILLSRLLILHRNDGVLTWRERCEDLCQSLLVRSAFNSKLAGKPALSCVDKDGGFIGKIMSRRVIAHRVIWAMATGKWPAEVIDHINGDRSDNRLENLRDVSHQQNNKNRKISKNNVSGTIGVRLHRSSGKWQAQIKIDGKNKHLGSFEEMADAIAARRLANIKHGFHANHGRPAQTGAKT